MLCSKEGFRAKKCAKGNNPTTHDETRVGCKAMVYVKKNEDRWIISRFIRDHNHALFSPESSQLANCFWVDSRSRMSYKYFGNF
jgi:hypothetical protein